MTKQATSSLRASSRRTVFVVACAVATVVAAVFARYRGLVFPVRIGSGSMAEQLLGPHYRVVCGECRFEFHCGLDVETPLGLAVCPNCGYQRNALSDGRIGLGEQVLIDRWAYWNKAPQRWDIVAFVDPANDRETAVKRIVGLPNERLRIAGGELFINGELYRKGLPAAKQVAGLVYDDSFRHTPAANLPSRWRSGPDSRGWRPAESGFVYSPKQHNSQSGTSWLVYHHWRCYGSPADRAEEVPVADNDGYNQGLSRVLNHVADVWLSLRASAPRDTTFTLLAHDGREFMRLVLSMSAATAELSRDDETVAQVAVPNLLPNAPIEIEYGIVDRQAFLTVNGRVRIWHRFDATDHADPTPQPQPLQIGVMSLGVVNITDLKVYRDIYYLGNAARAGAETTLGPDEYFLIGDNVPLSTDSRHWSQPGVSRSLLLGKVVKRK